MSKDTLQKILLVHPLGYKSEKASSDISRIANITPPLGIASICAYLNLNQIECDIIDCYAHPDADKKIITYLKTEKPQFIGFSCSTSTFNDGLRHAQIAKKILPDIKVVFGGAHVSALKESIINNFENVDYIVVGEGEQTLTELIKAENNNIGNIKK